MSDTTPTTETATRRFDPLSRFTWLEFAGRPEPTTIAALKAAGWRWSGYRAQWYTNHRYPNVPACVTTEDGGQADYATERADRLYALAERHEEKSSAAYQRSHDLVAMIPFGQPILVGHHSERADRNRRAKSWAAMDRSVAEAHTAERLHEAARASERRQARASDPGKLTRRAARLEAEARKMRRNLAERAERAESPQVDAWYAKYTRRAEAIEAEAADLRARVAALGGTRVEQLASQGIAVERGDLVRVSTFIGRVLRVNPKTITILIDGVTPRWPLKLDKTQLRQVITKAADLPPMEP